MMRVFVSELPWGPKLKWRWLPRVRRLGRIGRNQAQEWMLQWLNFRIDFFLFKRPRP